MKHYIPSGGYSDQLGDPQVGDMTEDNMERKEDLLYFKLLDDADTATATYIKEEVDPLIKRNIFAYIQKRMHSIDSFGKYVVRQMIRDGIYLSYDSSLIPLPDGFRLTIEVRLQAVSRDVIRKKIKRIYRTAFDLYGSFKQFRKLEEMLEEEQRRSLEESLLEVVDYGGGSNDKGTREGVSSS